jgi:purine-nucleoside phosphorylase
VTSPYELAEKSAAELRGRSGVDAYDVAVVLGSGWKEALGVPHSIVDATTLPGFFAPTVAGHRGEILSLRIDGANVALIAGRVHLYEGHSAHEVVHPVRTLIAAGADKIVLTNAAGGVNPGIAPGRVVVIRDHLNFTATSPLEGAAPPEGYGARFVDLTDLYSARLRAAVVRARPELSEGVYLGVRGPHYETPAEIAMAATLGASLVGMSTVLEAIAARHLGAEVLALSLVSNFAAGVSSQPLSHHEVLQAGQDASASLGALLSDVLRVL